MIRLVAKLIFVFVLVYAGVNLWYVHLEERLIEDIARLEKRNTPEHGPQRVPAAAPPKATDYRIIVTRNIFGARIKNDEGEKKEEIRTEDLEPTSLRLVLLGTVSGSKRDARAIIVDEKEKRQDIYQVGDAVQNAIIKAITRGKVVLNVNGKNEVLTIKDREGGGAGPPSVSGASTRTPARSGQSTPKIQTHRGVPVARPHRRVSFRKNRKVPHTDQKEQGQDERVEVLEEESQTETPPEETIPPEAEEGQVEENEPAS